MSQFGIVNCPARKCLLAISGKAIEGNPRGDFWASKAAVVNGLGKNCAAPPRLGLSIKAYKTPSKSSIQCSVNQKTASFRLLPTSINCENKQNTAEAAIKNMTAYPKNINSNGFLSPPIKSTAANTKLERSASVPGSERSASSSLSRITQIAPYQEFEDSSSITPSNCTCLDHLLAIFRIIFRVPVPKKLEKSSPGPVKGVAFDMESSPWVLPVLVVTTRRDTDKHPVIKRAKCTIDTGNMQGNIVSREFVEKVLQYSEANFVSLTAAEKEGGFGVTGHKLVPEGAIYLNWYYNKSTRIFHNMRFLVSPYSQCDLIIGARSIQKENLLGVPNLMATTTSRVAHITDDSIDEEEERLESIYRKRKEKYDEKYLELLEIDGDITNNKELKDYADARDVAEKNYLIRKAEVDNDPKLVAQLKEDLEKLPGYETYPVPSKSDTTSSGTAQQNGSVLTQRTLKKAVEQSSPKN